MGKTELRKSSNDRTSLLLIALASILLTTYVCPFAPFYRYCFETDESIYRVIALGWLRGRLPYRDLFDHKGPLAYVFYVLGLLLSGGKSWGIWILFCLINAGTYILVYMTFRLVYDEKISTVSVVLLLFLISFVKDGLLASASKPEHILLLFLMLSVYLFTRAVLAYTSGKHDKDDRTAVFPIRSILGIGLCCGAVFMVKFNACIFYLTFIGAYFLWLLLKKRLSEFFTRAGAFVAGIVLVTFPFVLYFTAMGGVTEFIDAYFSFNIHYGSSSDWYPMLFRSVIPISTKAVVLFFDACAVATVCIAIRRNTSAKKQNTVHLILGLLVYLFVSLPFIYYYSLIVLLPLFMYGLPTLVRYLMDRYSVRWSKGKNIGIFAFPILMSLLVNMILMPSIPKDPTDFESRMKDYSSVHPKASYLLFAAPAAGAPMFYDLTSEIPEFRYFYLPPRATDEMVADQLESISNQLPDVIVVPYPDMQDPDVLAVYCDFFSAKGYSYYCEGALYQTYMTFLVYTRNVSE